MEKPFVHSQLPESNMDLERAERMMQFGIYSGLHVYDDESNFGPEFSQKEQPDG